MQAHRRYQHGKKRRLVVTLLSAFLVTGCSHRVLTFFFTGVPDPNSPAEVAPLTTAEEDVIEVANIKVIPPQQFVTHGPWINRQCNQCHKSRSGQQFNVVGAAGISAQLNADLRVLCVNCHSYGFTNDRSANLSEHGPAANGYCVTCHNPHRSRREYMLLKADNRELCEDCHGSVEHSGVSQANETSTDCVRCHDPHRSERPLLLKAELSP